MFLRFFKRLVASGVALVLFGASSVQAATLSAPLIASQMMKNLDKVETMAFNGQIKLDTATTYSAKLKKEYDFYQDSKETHSVAFNGFLDAADENKSKMYLNVEIPNLFEGQGTAGTAQMIVLNKDIFFNITSDSIFNAIKEEGFDISSLNGQWIGVTEESLKNFYQEELGMDIEELGLADKANNLTPAQTKAVMKAIKDSGVMSFVKVADKAADAKGLYHMRVNVNKNKVVGLVKKLMKVTGEKPLTNTEIKSLERKLKDLQVPKIDIMVGKSDLLPHKIVYSQSAKKSYSYGYTDSTTVTVTLELSGFNMPVGIVAPTNYKLFDQVVADVQSQWEQEEKIQALDSKRLADLRQFQTALELYYYDQEAYPAGSNIILGTVNASCLSTVGWQTAGCSNAYMGYVPLDPGTSSYVYTVSPDGMSYTINTTFDTDVSYYTKGPVQLTPNGISSR